MKVIHRTDTVLILEDRPWLIGFLVIGMAMLGLFGSMAMFGSGQMLAGTVMGLFGVGGTLLIGALLVKRVRLILDRGTGKITRISRSVGGLTEEEYALSRLVEAQIGTRTDAKGTTRRAELLLSGPDRTLPFTDYYTSGGKPELMTQTINDWLGGHHAPLPSDGPGTNVKTS
ncbi:MAG: hypothetical protein U1E58_12040 [Tabrizicola sp.]